METNGAETELRRTAYKRVRGDEAIDKTTTGPDVALIINQSVDGLLPRQNRHS